ncbi:MAG TPA: Minf_1886 family protein [Thermoguttaceae bacterium]|nr:Minf_1886 family protein [Thermoguttaceae bacterium]
MLDPSHPIVELLKEDTRYTFDAYVFVFESLSYAQNHLGMGEEAASEPSEAPESESPQRHVTGQQLCEAIRHFALEQYGYMAKDVLASWGIHGTGDFGEIVFNLIRIGQMRKTPDDRREDFDNVYDFETAFRQGFKIAPPKES